MTESTPRPCYRIPAATDPRLAVKVGDRVRSFDFARQWGFVPAAWADDPALAEETGHMTGICTDGKHACYVEGVVVGITNPSDPTLPPHLRDCPRYRINVDTRVWSGERETEAREVCPPVNGTPTLMGRTVMGVHRL